MSCHCRGVSRAARVAMLLAVGVVRVHGARASPAAFSDEAVARGVIYVMQPYPQATGYVGFGCGFADLDGDGDEDIIAIGAADGRVGLFENDGSGQFVDRSLGSGIPLLAEGSAFAGGDYDGDGDVDLYLTQLAVPNLMMRNDGGFAFSDVTVLAGVGDVGGGKGASFGDYDGDGWLDLYVTNYAGFNSQTWDHDNKLYHNLGNGTFEDVSVEQTVNDHGHGFEAAWFDYDRDGDVDLYLSNDRGTLPPMYRGNQLWRNDGGQLVNVSEVSGAGVQLFSMGLACGDFDGNGWPDLYCTNIGAYEDGFNPLLLNRGDGTFVESSAEAGVDQYINSWGAVFFDFDNNGHQDLYVNNMFAPNTLYSCDGALPCAEVAGVFGVMGSSAPSFCAAVADVDGDGDLDMLENNLTGNIELFINHEGQTRSWVRVRLVGRGTNVHAIGGNVDVRVGDTWHFREVLAGGNGYLGQNELTIHVGLGDAEIVDEAVVRWPGGEVSRVLTHLPTNRVWHAYPPERLGDVDGDGSIDLSDFAVFESCGSGPSPGSLPPGCEMMDFDGDTDADVLDFGAFQSAFGGG